MTTRQEKAAAAHDRYQRNVEAVRSNSDLSNEGKRRQIAPSWVTTADAVAALAEGFHEDTQQERRQLEERLLRPGAPLGIETGADRIARDLSYRDALDRAERTDRPDLMALLQRSERAGDSLQVRACVATAVERNDLAVLNAHIEAHPSEEGPLQRLIELNGPTGLRSRIATEMAFAPPPVPVEFGGTGYERVVREAAAAPVPAPA